MAKVNWNIDYNETETAHVLDTEFKVFKRIPHEKKQAFAQEYTELAAILHDDGAALVSPYSDLYMLYLTVKYYTDIEISADDNLGWINDFDIEHDLSGVIQSIAGADLSVTRLFAERMLDVVLLGWEKEHDLAGTLSRLTSDNELDKLAHAAPLNNELIDLLHMRDAVQSGNVVQMQPLSEFAKKNK